jgi:hypothetical protein
MCGPVTKRLQMLTTTTWRYLCDALFPTQQTEGHSDFHPVCLTIIATVRLMEVNLSWAPGHGTTECSLHLTLVLAE